MKSLILKKNIILVFRVLTLWIISIVCAKGQTNLELQTPVYEYPFDSPDIKKAIHGSDALSYNMVHMVEDRFGNPNKAVYFTGSDSKYILPSQIQISLPDIYNENEVIEGSGYTVSFWINFPNTVTNLHAPANTSKPYLENDPVNQIFYGKTDANQIPFGLARIRDRVVLNRTTITNPQFEWYLWLWDPVAFTKTETWYQVVIVTSFNKTRVYLKEDNQIRCRLNYFRSPKIDDIIEWGLGSSDGNRETNFILDELKIFDEAFTEREVYQLTGIEYKKNVFAFVADYGCVGGSFTGDDPHHPNYGLNSGTSNVANMVKYWAPDFIISGGDDNYNDNQEFGCASTIVANTADYSEYIKPDVNSNLFYPVLGNHEYKCPPDGATEGSNCTNEYLNYFHLPATASPYKATGNERYYDFVKGDADKGSIHFIALNASPQAEQYDQDSLKWAGDPFTGSGPVSKSNGENQTLWLKEVLLNSTADFQVVYLHNPPLSSATAVKNRRVGHRERLQSLPLKDWGVDVILSGDDHYYERNVVDESVNGMEHNIGMTYIVNGLGGYPNLDHVDLPIVCNSEPEICYPTYTWIINRFEGSGVLGQHSFSAMKVISDKVKMHFEMHTTGGLIVDQFDIFPNPISSHGAGARLAYHTLIEETKGASESDSDIDFQTYPNPVSSMLNVQFKLAEASGIRFEIYDVNGKSFLNEFIPNESVGSHHYSFDLTSLSNGIYFMKVVTGDFSETRRIICRH